MHNFQIIISISNIDCWKFISFALNLLTLFLIAFKLNLIKIKQDKFQWIIYQITQSCKLDFKIKWLQIDLWHVTNTISAIIPLPSFLLLYSLFILMISPLMMSKNEGLKICFWWSHKSAIKIDFVPSNELSFVFETLATVIGKPEKKSENLILSSFT